VIKMKKTHSTLLIFCLLFTLSLISGFKVIVRAESEPILEVGQTEPYKTIQEAINNASSGATILVHPGVYNENVVVNKSVSLIGEVKALTTIDGNLTGTVVLIRADNVRITGFTIKNSRSQLYDSSGIFVDHSDWVNISNNSILNARDGIDLFYSNGNSILNNTISFNYNGGIVLSSSSYNLVSDNNISTDFLGFCGIQLYSSTHNVVTRNVAFSSLYGIYLSSASYNVISGNNVFSNYHVGIDVIFSSFNTIYHNNFNNTINVQSEGDVTSTWSFEGEGNYWSDYSGQDPTQDGIGDTAYFINSFNKDNHPLMGRFSDFGISLGNETFSVTVISNSTISNFEFEIGAETGNKIISYGVSGPNATSGFCRVSIPTKLMNAAYVVLVGNEEVVPKLLTVSNDSRACLYFAYLDRNQTVTLISSEALRLYYGLLDRFVDMQRQFYGLNASYYSLLDNFTTLLSNQSQLQERFDGLNNSFYDHLLDYDTQMQNMRNLMYILAAATAIFLIATVYLSRIAHSRAKTRIKVIRER